MTKIRSSRRSRERRSPSRRSGERHGLYVAIPVLVFGMLAERVWLLLQRQPTSGATPEEVRTEIIPKADDPTAYDLPLSLRNTQRFIHFYEASSLTPEQQQIVDDALSPLKAPCCEDNPLATCCCDCNLAKSVWGLSGYLAVEKGLDAQAVRKSALQWLRFIRPGYYVGQELASRGVNPSPFHLPEGDTCYVGECELPFTGDGCGGMGVLVQ